MDERGRYRGSVRRPATGWIGRSPWLKVGVFVLMLAAIGLETVLLRQAYGARATARARQAWSRGDSPAGEAGESPGASDVYIRLQNVRFKWSDKVFIDAGDMAVRAAPVKGTTVDFDDLESFSLNLQQSVVLIRPDVLAGMFNESIFSYPGSRVRNLKVSVIKDDQERWTVKLDGRLGVVATVPFSLFTHLSVDTASNELVIDTDHLTVFGFLPATKLIHWTPLHLDRLIALPPNRSLIVDGNQIRVKPFGLFPPPRIDGRMSKVEVSEDAIRITFAGNALPAPMSSARNYVFLRGGTSQFGHFRMTDTDVLIVDRDPANPFVFSLKHYAEMIPSSTVALANTKSIRLTMPDF